MMLQARHLQMTLGLLTAAVWHHRHQSTVGSAQGLLCWSDHSFERL